MIALLGYNRRVPAPTNPRKKSLMPSSPLRRALRGAGHHLSPVVQVGKEGVTDAVIRQLDEALDHHELVKVKIGTESPEDRFEAAEAIAGRAGAQVAQILGRTVLAYRRHPEHPRFEAAPYRPRSDEPPALPSRSARTTSARRPGKAPARGAGKSPARGGAKPAGRGAAKAVGRGTPKVPGRPAAKGAARGPKSTRRPAGKAPGRGPRGGGPRASQPKPRRPSPR